jgi:hypothetical protein
MTENNTYNVVVLPASGGIIPTQVDGTDGPNFKDIYAYIGCNTIEITGARLNDKDYDLYINEEGRMTNNPMLNQKATEYFVDWLDKENRTTMIPNIIGNAVLVERVPVNG